MAGNVWEWCADGYHATPRGLLMGAPRALRGGAWDSSAEAIACASRSGEDPHAQSPTIGFRCVFDVRKVEEHRWETRH